MKRVVRYRTLPVQMVDQNQEEKTDDQILAEALDAFDNKMKSSDQQSNTQNSVSQTSAAGNNSNSSEALTDGEKFAASKPATVR